jgi:photosystem II stability/assembly factor-like uncharacterized protein
MQTGRAVVFALTSLVLISVATRATGAVWTSLGPEGGTVDVLVADPTNPAIVYAANSGGVRKSTDGGVTWTDSSTGLGPAVSVQEMVIDPSNPSVLYVAGFQGKGVYKTVDAGAHWSPARTGLPVGDFITAAIQALAIDPVTTAVLYAATPGGFYKTINAGATWGKITTSGVPAAGANTGNIVIDPLTPTTLYADNGGATSPGLVIKSTDGGVTWAPAGSGLPPAFSSRALAIDPVTPSTLYAAFCGDGVYKTIDGGAAWTPAVAGLPADPCVTSLALDPATPSTLYAGHRDFTGPSQVFTSTNGAGTWAGTSLVGPQPNTLATGAPGRVLLGTFGRGVYRSTDAGTTWAAANAGLRNLNVGSIALDPASASTIYLGADGGLFKSVDGGATWTVPASPLFDDGTGAIAIDPTTPATLYAAVLDGIAKSTDSGATWTLCPGSPTNTHVLTIDPAAPSHLFAGGYNAGVNRSLDGCASWTPGNAGLTDTFIQAMVVAPGAPSTLYLATSVTGIFRSTDTGASWSPINNGFTVPGDGLPRVLAVDPLTPSTLYATIGDQMFKTTNGGAAWTLGEAGLVATDYRAIAVDPVHPSRVFLGGEGLFTTGSVFGTGDAAQTWSSLTADLQNPGIEALAVDPSAGTMLFAGTNGSGLFVRNTVCSGNADCDDGDLCTVGTCSPDAPGATIDGCVFAPLACPGDACHFAGSCNPDTGLCEGLPNVGAPCEDGDPCTYDTCSDTGECVGAMIPSPLCKQPVLAHASTIAITNATDDTRDRLVWQWKKGEATTAADLGDPTATTGYRLCVFDNNAGPTRPVDTLAPAGGTCNGQSCWTVSGAGAHYRNSGAAGNGLEQIRIQPGRYGFGKVVVKARGPNLGLPARALSPAVTLQLVRTDDPTICWKARFNSGITRQDATTFRAKSD